MYNSKNLCDMLPRYYDLGLRNLRYHLVTVKLRKLYKPSLSIMPPL